MLDNHYVPNGYGIIPNFTFGTIKISTYTFFVILGLIVGIIWFSFSIDKNKHLNKNNSYYIVIGALIGGIIGSKIPVIIENIDILLKDFSLIKNFIFTGKSIVGGLIGGYLGVRITKKIMKMTHVRSGNQIAPAIALGMAIGRIGCFLTGCCYGIKTSLPIGVDFGDGLNRLPTQLFESLFCFILFAYLFYEQRKNKELEPGILFKKLILYYFIFRFLIEFLRDTNKNILFLSIYQIICILGFLIVLIQIKRSKKYERKK